jgi:hypothetical protein
MRVLVLWAALGLAAHLFVFTELASVSGRFLALNRVGKQPLDLALLGVVLVPAGIAFGANELARRIVDGWARLARWGTALLPALVLPLLPGLFARSLWKDSTQELLMLCAALAAYLEATLNLAIPIWKTLWPAPPALAAFLAKPAVRWAPRVALGAAVAYYALRVSALTIANHQRLGTSSADLAEFDSLFFNTLHGHPFRSPPIDGSLADWNGLKVHFELLLYALLPLYALEPGPETLLALQSCTVALTALPLYAFAARRLGEPLALLCALALLLMPAVEQPNFYDFHFLPLGMLCVMTAIFCADRWVADGARRRLWAGAFGAAVVASLFSREDMAFGVGLLGLFLWGTRAAPRAGLTVAAVSFLWFGVVRFFVMPRIGDMWFMEMYADLRAPSRDGTLGVLATVLTNPVFVLHKLLSIERLRYVLELAVPLAFLWLRRPWLALAALPAIPFTLLVTNRDALNQTSFQYVYHFIPYIFAASVLGLELVGPAGSARRLAAAAALAFSTLTLSYHRGALLGAGSILGGPTQVPLQTTAAERERTTRLNRVLAALPPDASVAATEHEGPHVSTRLLPFTMYAARGHDPRFLLLNASSISRTEYVLLRELSPEKYRLVRRDGEFYLLERGAPDGRTHALLAALAARFEK